MSDFLPAEKALGMYKKMYEIRKYEESIYYLFLEGTQHHMCVVRRYGFPKTGLHL